MLQFIKDNNKIMNYYIGIDIGLKGGLSLIDDNKKLFFVKSIPTIDVLVGKKIRKQYDIKSIIDIIETFTIGRNITMTGFERLRAIPSQSSQTAFSMGGGAMLFKSICTFLEIPFTEIEPRAWQQKIFNQLGIQYNKDTTKKASIQAAKQLFPGELFLPNDRCRTASDGMTDAALIGLYIKILNS